MGRILAKRQCEVGGKGGDKIRGSGEAKSEPKHPGAKGTWVSLKAATGWEAPRSLSSRHLLSHFPHCHSFRRSLHSFTFLEVSLFQTSSISDTP
jgi:hypothetical protein